MSVPSDNKEEAAVDPAALSKELQEKKMQVGSYLLGQCWKIHQKLEEFRNECGQSTIMDENIDQEMSAFIEAGVHAQAWLDLNRSSANVEGILNRPQLHAPAPQAAPR